MIDSDIVMFAHIIEAGSLSAAARTLRMSPAMMSRRLARLEARLGVKLAHRTTRRLELTSQGERFHRDVVAILAALEEAEARMKNTARVAAGPLKISAPTSFGRMHIAPMLHDFLERHPQVKVTLELSDAYVDMLAGRFDLAIRITSDIPSALEAERLAISRRILCAAPRYLQRHGEPANMAQLKEHKLLAADGQLPWKLNIKGKEVLFPGESVVRTNSSEVVRELAVTGAGIALRSLWDVHSDLAAGRLRPILPQVEGALDVGIYALRPRANATPAAVEAFVAHLRQMLQPHPPWEAQNLEPRS